MVVLRFYARVLRASDPPDPLLLRPAGKSLVPEPEDEVQAAEAGGGGLGVAAEEERLASHKPVEARDQTGESGRNRRHFGRLETPSLAQRRSGHGAGQGQGLD